MKVYRLRLLPPTVNAHLVREQAEKARAYRNLLVEVERARREWIAGRLDAEPTVEPLLATAEAAQVHVEALITGGASPQSQIAIQAKRTSAAAWIAYKAEKKRVAQLPDVAVDVAAVDAEAHRLRLHARACCGLAWGTYQAVEEAHRAACVSAAPPDFVRRGRGDMVAVHVQNRPLSVPELLSGLDTRARLSIPPDDAPRGVVRVPGQLGERPKGRLQLRVGSEGRDPVWAEWPVKPGQRALPPEARVVWVKVFRKEVGPSERWEAQVTLDGVPCVAPTDSPHVAIAALDVGWRRVPGREGLRVGFLATNRGTVNEIVVGEWLLWSAREVDRWHGIRDVAFNAALSALREWLLSEPTVPAWFAEDVANFGQKWYKVGRLRRLALRWRGERFAGDNAVFNRVNAWCAQDRHLWAFEAHLRDQYLARRTDFYRVFAKRLATSHRVIAVERLDLTKFATADEVCADVPTAARYYNRLACLSSFFDALKNACQAYGARYVEMDAENTTRACWDCGHVDAIWDPAVELVHRCPKCLRSTDQDEQAARNLLARATEWWGVPGNRSIPELRRKSNAWATRKAGKASKAPAEGERSRFEA